MITVSAFVSHAFDPTRYEGGLEAFRTAVRTLVEGACASLGTERMPVEAELVFEASGAPAALGGVLRATARGGTLVQVGNLPGTAVSAVLGDLVTREITWVGAYRFVEEISDALVAMRDGLDVSPLITHRFPIEEAADALAVAADRTTGSSKVMLRLGGAG